MKEILNTLMMKKAHSIFLIFTFFMILIPLSNAEALCVKVKNANLRKGPGLNFQNLWQVFKYMPFKRIGKKGQWLRVKDVDGDIFWIHKKLVTRAFKCAVVKKESINFRQGPGTKFPKTPWSPVEKYYSAKVIKIKGKWVKVMDSMGDVAWVYRPLVWIQ